MATLPGAPRNVGGLHEEVHDANSEVQSLVDKVKNLLKIYLFDWSVLI